MLLDTFQFASIRILSNQSNFIHIFSKLCKTLQRVLSTILFLSVHFNSLRFISLLFTAKEVSRHPLCNKLNICFPKSRSKITYTTIFKTICKYLLNCWLINHAIVKYQTKRKTPFFEYWSCFSNHNLPLL